MSSALCGLLLPGSGATGHRADPSPIRIGLVHKPVRPRLSFAGDRVVLNPGPWQIEGTRLQ